jgi:hypothetical protein
VTPRSAVRLAWGLWGLAACLIAVGWLLLGWGMVMAAATLAVAALFQPASASLWLRSR